MFNGAAHKRAGDFVIKHPADEFVVRTDFKAKVDVGLFCAISRKHRRQAQRCRCLKRTERQSTFR